ncbi:hypothetical protein D3C71_1488220 [compost metagenome]
MAAADADRHGAIGTAEHGRDGVALAGQVDVATDTTGGLLGQLRIGEQLAQLHLADGGLQLSRNGLLAGIHPDRAADIAAGNTKVERFQAQQPVIELEVRIHVIQRQGRRIDPLRFPAHIGIHRAQLGQVVGRIR